LPGAPDSFCTPDWPFEYGAWTRHFSAGFLFLKYLPFNSKLVNLKPFKLSLVLLPLESFPCVARCG